jgi:TolA-binding protein
MVLLRNFLVSSVLLFSVTTAVVAQETEVYKHASQYFEEGLELHRKALFGPSSKMFQQYIGMSADQQKSQKAKMFILINNVKLDHKNAASELDLFVRKQGMNNETNYASFALADYYFQKGKYRRAARLFDKVDVTNLPVEYWEEANFKMGYSYMMAKKYDQAKPVLNKIRSKEGPYFVQANYYYGYIAYVEKDYITALKSFDKIEGKGPQIMELYRAQIYYAQKGYQQSIDHIEKSKTSKYQKEFDLLKAKAYFQLDNYEQAGKYFAKVGAIYNELSPEDIWQMAFTQYQNKNYKAAHPLYVKITGEESALGQLANYQLGECFIHLKKKQNALNAFASAKSTTYNPEITEISHFNYAKLAFELGYQNVTLKTTRAFIKKYPKSEYLDPVKGMLVEILLNTKNYDLAIKILEEIKNFNSQTRMAYQKITYLRGEQEMDVKAYKSAQAFFIKSLKFNDDPLLKAQAYFWLGEIEYKNNNFSASIQNYNRFLASSSVSKSKYRLSAYYTMGYSYFKQKSYSKALNFFKKYKDNASLRGDKIRYADNLLRLGDSYFLLAQYSKAITSYNWVSSKKLSGSDYAIFQEGIIQGLMRKPEKKVVVLNKLVQAYPKSRYADNASFEMANTYYEDLDNAKKASNIYQKVIAKNSKSKFARLSLFKLGLIHYQQGENDLALGYFERVVVEFPRTASAKDAMDLVETIYIKSGRGDEYIAWVNGLPNGNIRITKQDSLMFESAMGSYRSDDCLKAIIGFNKYIDRFSPNGFFLIHSHFYKSECQYHNNEIKNAIVGYKYVAGLPNNEFSEVSFSQLAQISYNAKNYAEALEYYDKLELIADNRDNYIQALVGQMRCNFELENYAESKENAKIILPLENIEQDMVLETNLVLGKIQYMDSNLSTAKFHFTYVVDASKTSKGAEAQYYIAKIALDKGEYEQSRTEIFTLDDNYASYGYWVIRGFVLLADVYIAEQDYFQARATLKSILDSYTENDEIVEECNRKMAQIKELESSSNDARGESEEELDDE